MSDLNEMVRKHNNGEPYDFENFMQQYGDFFPENPQNLEELLETLARRIAMAQAMMNVDVAGDAPAARGARSGSLMQDADLDVPDERAGQRACGRRCPATSGTSSTSSAATSRST